MVRKIYIAFRDLFRLPIIYMPGTLGRKLRYWYYKKKLKKCGKNVIIDEGVIIQNPKWISIGNNVWIDKYCILIAGKANLEGMLVKRIKNHNFEGQEGELIIGSNVHIAPFCLIQAHSGLKIGNNCGVGAYTAMYSLSHHYKNLKHPDNKNIYFTAMAKKQNQYLIKGPIVIGDNVGIARGSFIYCGVTIGEDSFIKAYSEVGYNIPSNTIFDEKTGKFVKRFNEVNK